MSRKDAGRAGRHAGRGMAIPSTVTAHTQPEGTGIPGNDFRGLRSDLRGTPQGDNMDSIDIEADTRAIEAGIDLYVAELARFSTAPDRARALSETFEGLREGMQGGDQVAKIAFGCFQLLCGGISPDADPVRAILSEAEAVGAI